LKQLNGINKYTKEGKLVQNFKDFESKELLSDSRELLLNNDKTVMSNNSGDFFPTLNTQVGMTCFRTDQLKLYQLRDTVPTWVLIADLGKSYTSKDYVDSTFSVIGHKHVKADISDWTHTHQGADIAIATKSARGAVMVGNGLTVDANTGRVDVQFASNTAYINPTTPKDGDIYSANGLVYIRSNGIWCQVYPAIYSS
jgi:hypothetical protein